MSYTPVSKGRTRVLMFLRGGPSSPKVMSVRVHTPTGERILVIKPEAKRPFAIAADAIIAMHAKRLEARDKDEQVVRALDLEEEPETEAEVDADADPDAQAIVPTTRMGSELVLMSQLLANAYHQGATQHAEFANQAYTKLVEVTQTAFSRLEGLEKAWTRMLNTQIRAASGGKDPDEKDVGSQVQEMLAGVIGANIARHVAQGQAPAAKANGSTHAKEPSEGSE
jgi:hypothetical protein